MALSVAYSSAHMCNFDEQALSTGPLSFVRAGFGKSAIVKY